MPLSPDLPMRVHAILTCLPLFCGDSSLFKNLLFLSKRLRAGRD